MQEETLTQQEHLNQRKTVKQIVIDAGKELRTDEIRIIALKRGISCADTYLRMLARDNEISRFWEMKETKNGKKQRSNKTKLWSSNEYFNGNIKSKLGGQYAQ